MAHVREPGLGKKQGLLVKHINAPSREGEEFELMEQKGDIATHLWGRAQW